MKYPLFSIAIATFNSEKTLALCLDSIKKQIYPASQIEVLIIDGGSTDKTLKIAKKYKYKVISNPQTEIIYAKQIGFTQARGKYLMYLDSDEVLDNPDSLKIKYQTFAENRRVGAIIPSGYQTPQNFPAINYYSNDFGDPFSYFMYRESKADGYFLPELMNKYSVVQKTNSSVVFNFKKSKKLPLVELFAGGCTLDLSFCRKKFPQIKHSPELIALLFYLLNQAGCYIAVTKNDPTIHYSLPSVEKYLKKISSRVKNNIFATSMGQSGYSGREKFQQAISFKKFLFLPYAFLIILPLIDSVRLVFAKKKLVYLWHLPLSIYTAYLIVYFYLFKLVKPAQSVAPYGS